MQIEKKPISNLVDAQEIMVNILDVFSEICHKNNLDYWLGSGTLLGAVRHKGFIPWDDDLDVMMPRKDYNKFLEIAPLQLPDNIFLQTKDTDKHYRKEFAKLRNKNSKIVEPAEINGVNYHQGLFVDIFPMDLVAKNKRFFYSIIKHFFIQEFLPSARSKILPRILYIFGYIIFMFVNKEKAKSFVVRKIYSNCNEAFYSFGLEVPFERFIPAKDIYPLVPILFCRKMYSGPCNPDGYLKITYGNYMKLPSPEKRETHAVSIEIFKNQPV